MPVIKSPQADLRAKYAIYLKVSFIFSILILIAAFTFAPFPVPQKPIIDPDRDSIIVVTIPTVQKKNPPPLKPPTPILATTDDIIEDIILDDTEINFDDKLYKPPDLLDRDEVYKDEPFIEWASQMPEPIGGLQAIREKVEYTTIARKIGLEGKVVIEAWVDELGNVKDAIIVRDIGGGLGESVVKAILKTKFIPGKQGNTPVRVKMKIPIVFKLR
ncbi:MAG: energy transducer TonB [Ignavibacteria bacterium]|jgi:protein TonB